MASLACIPTDMAPLFVMMLWLETCHCILGMIYHDTWGAPQPEFLFARWILEVSSTKKMHLWLPYTVSPHLPRPSCLLWQQAFTPDVSSALLCCVQGFFQGVLPGKSARSFFSVSYQT